jgi:hypothetical protein
MREISMLANLSRHCSIVGIGFMLAAIAGTGARAQMSAPLVGLIAGESHGEIRPVLGVLGASSIQAPMHLPRGVSRVHLAPTGGWALVQQRGKAPGLVTFQGSVASAVQTIADAAPSPDLVSFSPLGRSAGLLASSSVIQVLTGLDSTPRVAFEVNFFDTSGVKKIAVSDDGQLLAVLTAAGQVYMLSNSIAPLFAYAGSPSLGMAFLPNQATVVMADAANGAINLARIVNGVPVLQPVTGSLNAASGETLVEASRDGASAFVVASGGTSACRIDLATGGMQSMTLPAVATRLDRLRDGESFVFSAEPGHSAWFLTGRDSGMQAVFAADGTQPGNDRRLR